LTQPSWWKGSRGEWYVVVQVVLMLLVFLGPRTLPGWRLRPYPLAPLRVIAGGILMALGGLLLAAALVRLGPGLTPLPYPKDGAALVRTGPYGLVRHPMYGGGLMIAFGWALFVRGPLTLGYALLLLLLLEVKSRREERWLAERFPDYAEYQRRVPKLIPFVY
jgi:protein-S-isoprenylcysteine O-methyltransferase Ste14